MIEIRIIKVKPGKDGRVRLHQLLKILGKSGICSVLVEGGSMVAASLLKQKLVDKIVFFYTPKIIGGDALSMIGDLEKKMIKNSIEIKDVKYRRIGEELMVEGYLN